MTPITGISTSPILQPSLRGGGGPASDGQSFKDFLVQSIQDVNSMQAAADKAVEKVARRRRC